MKTMLHRRRATRAAWRCAGLAFVLALAGCASGQRIEAERYQQLEEGRTTKSQLIEVLGEPNSRGFEGNNEVLGYQFSKTDATSYIPFINILKNGAQVQMCYFTFNTKSVLTHKLCSESKGSSGLIGG